MTVTEVLILAPLVWLRQIVFAVAVAWIGGEDRRALIEVKRNVALQSDREGAIGAGSEQDRASACCGCGIDGFVNGGAVEGFSIAFRAILSDVEGTNGLLRNGDCGGWVKCMVRSKWGTSER